MPVGLEPASAAGPTTLYINTTSNDPLALLPEAAAAKLVALRQRVRDAHLATPKFEDVDEVRKAVAAHRQRISDLTKVRAAGGFGLDERAEQVVTERDRLKRAEKELARLTALKDERGARWTVAGQLERAVSDWVTRGIPANCVLEAAVDDASLEELLKKGERIADAVERHRRRLRELDADLHRVRSAPWPASVAKAAVKAQLDALAQAGAPDVDRAIEHGQPVAFPTTMLSAVVNGGDGFVGTTHIQTVDAAGLVFWALRSEIEAKICAALDEIADEKHAMDAQQREEKEAQIGADTLAIERDECAAIWAAESKSEIIDFRRDTAPAALLGVQLVTVQRAAPTPGSSREWSSPVGIAGRR